MQKMNKISSLLAREREKGREKYRDREADLRNWTLI